jgi:hypothetical protein
VKRRIPKTRRPIPKTQRDLAAKRRAKKARELQALREELWREAEEAARAIHRWRRRRLRDYHHLYVPLTGADPEVCYYCGKRATTKDHCPSLAWLDGAGVKFFERMRIPLVLIPACRDCNQGTDHVFRNGRVVRFDYRRLMRIRRQRYWRGRYAERP